MKNKNNKVLKKNKKKIAKIIFILIILVGITIYAFNLKIKNIYVVGNNYLTDQEIIELSGIENYPNMFKYSCTNLENKIKINPYIKSVKVKKDLFGKITFLILEHDLLLKSEMDNQIYLASGKTIQTDNDVMGIPSLTNYVDVSILNPFLEKLSSVNKSVLSKISEITYTPNNYDNDLFLFYMTDGNYVYITTKRLLNINKYEEVLVTLEGKKGILYLDSGNHFEIFK